MTPSLSITHELHVHLYGCLDAKSLWLAAKDTKKNADKIAWYKAEFLKAYERPSRIDEFWTHDDGAELLAAEYCYTEGGAFSRFQASINLPIALFPLQTDACPLLDASVAMHHREGLKYVEYRVFLPQYLAEHDRHKYMSTMAGTAKKLEDLYAGEISVRIIFSIARPNNICTVMYASLKLWQSENRDLSKYVTGIDFCASEDGFPPKDKKDFCKKLHLDNAADPQFALALLYHVGETFEHLRPESAVRWIHEAHQLGAHRLGHCSALGINSAALLGRKFSEPQSERQDHLNWLLLNKCFLAHNGYDVDQAMDSINHSTFNSSQKSDFDQLQNAVLAEITATGTIIETCPTSNQLIGHTNASHLPFHKFLNEKSTTKTIIGADDPGIFACSLHDEFTKCNKLGISFSKLREASALARASTAAALVGRE